MVFEIDGIDVKRLMDFDINSMTFTDGKIIRVNEYIEYEQIDDEMLANH